MIERDKEFYNQKISELYAVIENKEKIIRDLQNQNIELKKQVDFQLIKISFLIERIDKAIEFIKDNHIEVLRYDDEPSETTSYEIVRIDLLKILRGKDE